MANDPGLSGDTCIYMEAVAGDGGVHNSSGVWWLSPDIQLTGPTSGPDKADPGVVNPVTVTTRRKSESSDCILAPGAESITVQGPPMKRRYDSSRGKPHALLSARICPGPASATLLSFISRRSAPTGATRAALPL